MDRVMDGGVALAQDLKDSLKELKVLWLDPNANPSISAWKTWRTVARRVRRQRAGDFEFVRKQMKQIRPVDLRMGHASDFLVVNIDLDIHATGTYEELYWANRCKKPCIMRIAQGIEHTPDWLLGTLPLKGSFRRGTR